MSRTFASFMILIPVLTVSVAMALPPTSATRTFLDNNTDARAKVADGRIVALFGGELGESDTQQQESTDDFVARFISENADALGVDDVDLVLKDSILLGSGNTRIYTYTQRIDGLPVHGGMVKIPVRLGTPDKIGYVGARLVDSAGGLPEGDVNYADATQKVREDRRFRTVTSFDESGTEVVYEAEDGSVHRAWHFHGRGEDGTPFGYFVDSDSGEIVGSYEAVAHATQQAAGTVTGWASEGFAAWDNSVEPVPLSGLEVRLVPGEIGPGGECPPGAGTSQQLTCADGTSCTLGEFDFGSADTPAVVTASLTGEWVRVFDCRDLNSGNVGTCNQLALEQADGGPQVLREWRVCEAVGLGTEDLTFGDSGSDELDVAPVNAFVVVSQTHDWLKAYQPNYDGMDRQIVCGVNAPGSSGGLVDASGNAFSVARGNSEFHSWAIDTILAHEYGHLVFGSFVPHPIQAQVMGEGVADIIAMLSRDNPCFGENLEVGSPPGTCRRDHSIEYCDYNCDNGSAHNRGNAIAGPLWILRDDEKLGLAGASQLFTNFMMITDGGWDGSVVAEMLMADEDDDADICNGTENSAVILDAFNEFGWPLLNCEGDDGSVAVTWPLIDPGVAEPVESVDYAVDYSFDPPRVALKTRQYDDVSISWQVARNVAGRPADVALITADWDSGDPFDVEVVVGHDTDKTLHVANVNIIEVPPQDSTTWSNIFFQLRGTCDGGDDDGDPCAEDADCTNGGSCVSGRVARARATANSSGEGGRISGDIFGEALLVYAETIGAGATTSGTLTFSKGSFLNLAELVIDSAAEVPAAGLNRLSSPSILGDLSGTLSGPRIGTLRVGGSITSSGDVHFLAPLHGNPNGIFVDGDIAGAITIEGNYAGNIIANADGMGGNGITGDLIINGTFNGNICAANLATVLSPGDLPGNIDIAGFGSSAEICGRSVAQLAPKGRFITLFPTDVGPSRIRVTPTSLHRPSDPPPNSPDFSACEAGENCNDQHGTDCIRWVGPVSDCPEGGSSNATFKCAPIQCTPYENDWSEDLEGQLLHVYGSLIIPSSEYQIDQVDDEMYVLAAEPNVATSLWGDVIGTGGMVNVLDLSAVVDKIKDEPSAIPKVRALLAGFPLDAFRPANVLDVSIVGDVLRGDLFPNSIQECPCN